MHLAESQVSLPSPPNIVWIVADEMRPDALGCYGSALGATPNLDALARRGAQMRRAVTQAPLCVPARAAFMTGKYSRTLGVHDNTDGLNFGPWHRARLAEKIAELGPAWDKRRDATIDAMRDRLSKAFSEGLPESFLRSLATGTAERALAAEIGLETDGPQHTMFTELLADAGYQTINIGKLHHNGLRPGFQEQPHAGDGMFTPFGLRADLGEAEGDIVRLPSFMNVMLAGTCPIPADETTEALRTDLAIEYLRGKVTAPFLLRISYDWPHTPVLPPRPFDSMFDPRCFVYEPPTDAELASKPRYESSYRTGVFNGQALTEQQIQLARAHYYGLCAFVDRLIGRVVDEVARSPYANNTIIVFHADHGTLLGEHGLWQKETFYEQVAGVPFIVAGPGVKPGHTVDAPVQLIDLAPTLLAATATLVPPDIEGIDLGPWLQGATSTPHEVVFSEVRGNGSGPGEVRRMVSDGEWRLEATLPTDDMYGPDGALYRPADDPAETNNRYYDRSCRDTAQGLLEQLNVFAEAAP